MFLCTPVRTAVIVLFSCSFLSAGLVLDQQRDHLSLNGTWQVLRDHPADSLWLPDSLLQVTDSAWQTAEVPGNLIKEVPPADQAEGTGLGDIHKRTVCAWLRRTVTLDSARAAGRAMLRWGGIKFGAAAWVNGTLVAEYAPIGPHTVMLPDSLLHAGDNTVLLKIPGWAGVAKSASGFPLTPVGASTQGWGGKGPQVTGDIWLEFYTTVAAKYVLALPDPEKKSVTFRLWLDGADPLPGRVDAAAFVYGADSDKPVAKASAKMKGVRDYQELTCSLPVFKPWTPRTPDLYTAEIVLTAGNREYDRVRFTFGMRRIGIRNGRFTLNGKPLWLRGSDILSEWSWGPKYEGKAKEYLVDEARAMNLNCFRTHTTMPPAAWLDVTDRYGTMILAESPLLYNHMDFDMTPEEYAVFHANALNDQAGWMTRLWNHPSVIIWVISNESSLDGSWESGELYKRVTTLDPTRPVMRTGDERGGSPDMVDVHTCFNMKHYADGSLIEWMTDLAAHRDPDRPLCNTEYMNLIGKPRIRISGGPDEPAWPLLYAEFALEHTEAMRRLQFDCLLPYMYARWSRLNGRNSWRPEYAHPVGAALHSAMAPVAASLELFDRNFATGRKVSTVLHLINETYEKTKAVVDVYVTPHHPLFLPDPDSLKGALYKNTLKFTLRPSSHTEQAFTFPVPDREGTYYLAVVLRRQGDTPVVCQREIHAVDVPAGLSGLKGRRVMLLGADAEIRTWLKAAGAHTVSAPVDRNISADVVLIWNVEKVTNVAFSYHNALKRYAAEGGRIVVADQRAWNWGALADVHLGAPQTGFVNTAVGSRAFTADSTGLLPALRDIPRNWFMRWNGLPGVIAETCILPTSPVWDKMDKQMWVSKTDHFVLGVLPQEKGAFVFCQLKIRGRLDKRSKFYDPVAERVLADLLTK